MFSAKKSIKKTIYLKNFHYYIAYFCFLCYYKFEWGYLSERYNREPWLFKSSGKGLTFHKGCGIGDYKPFCNIKSSKGHRAFYEWPSRRVWSLSARSQECFRSYKNQNYMLFGNKLSEKEKKQLATLVYYPEKKLDYLKRKKIVNDAWYEVTLGRLSDFYTDDCTKKECNPLRTTLSSTKKGCLLQHP